MIADSETDLIVVGGGFLGLALSLIASERGYSVLLLERGQICSATSASSLRVVHAGFRYLQNMQIARTRESYKAACEWQQRFGPHVSKLDCLLPLESFGLRSKIPMALAGLLYSAITCGGGYAQLRLGERTKFSPRGCFTWQDYLLTDPAAISAEITSRIRELGGLVRVECPVISISKCDYGFAVRTVRGDKLRSRCVVNSAGYSAASIRPAGLSYQLPTPEWALAYNILTEHTRCSAQAVVVRGKSGKNYFVVNRGSQTAIGTAYQPLVKGHQPQISDASLTAILEDMALERLGLTLDRAGIRIEKGMLPIVTWKTKGPLSEPEFFDEVFTNQSGGYAEVLGTKFTTCFTDARKILDKLPLEA